MPGQTDHAGEVSPRNRAGPSSLVSYPRSLSVSACRAKVVADVVCLRGTPIQKTFGEKGREASFLSRLPAAPGRAGARALGARCSSTRAKRGAQRSPPRSSRPQCQRLQRRVGGADASAARWPGAALARVAAGPRSAAREHRRRVRQRVRERRDRPFSCPSEASSDRPRRFDIAFGYVKGPAAGRTRRREGRPRGAKRSGTSAAPGPISALIGKRP